MKKFTAALMILALCLSLSLTVFAADYAPKAFECWWNSDGATVTIDKVRVENYENYVPVGATVTYTAASEGPFCIGRDYYLDGVNLTSVHWCYDPAAGTMVPAGYAFVSGHHNCPTLTAGGTYTFTITEEMAESLSVFSKLTQQTEYAMSGVTIEAGRFSDLGFEIGTEYLVIEAPAAKPQHAFTDVPAGAYYADAVQWAFENGITTGTTATTFGPTETCTRGQVVTFLWRANGKPAAETTGTQYYDEAVAWGNANQLLAGTASPFAPENLSPRADIVTYLYRDIAQ